MHSLPFLFALCYNDGIIIKLYRTRLKMLYFPVSRKKCLTKYHLLLRAWRTIQIRGIISMSIRFPFSEAVAPSVRKTAFLRTVYKAVRKSEQIVAGLNDPGSQSSGQSRSRDSKSSQSLFELTARARQRKMALASAYSLVPVADKFKLTKKARQTCCVCLGAEGGTGVHTPKFRTGLSRRGGYGAVSYTHLTLPTTAEV